MKPSKIDVVKAKKACLLFSNFKAITWLGTVYCKRDSDVEEINKKDTIDSSFKSHETIHVRQAYAMKNSWFIFYLNYIFNWIKNLPLLFINIHAPYKLIPTEIEAYLYQDDWKYAAKNEPVYEWKRFQKLKLSEKREIANLYYKVHKKDKTYSSVLFDYFMGNP